MRIHSQHFDSDVEDDEITIMVSKFAFLALSTIQPYSVNLFSYKVEFNLLLSLNNAVVFFALYRPRSPAMTVLLKHR